MNRMPIVFAVIFLSCTGCASEKMRVSVKDNFGEPVSNAAFTVSFTSGHVVFGAGTSYDYSGETDRNGNAEIAFNCDSSDVYWSVNKDGYYPYGPKSEYFRIEEVFIPPLFYNVVMLEHEKEVKATLWRKINPQPMYAHFPVEFRKVPKAEGRYGFDLMEYDWLPPNGSGKIADFYVVKEHNDIPAEGEYVWGRIEFDKGCGYYIDKKNDCQSFPGAYSADTNKIFATNIVLKCVQRTVPREWTLPLPIIGKDEYLVLRTRALFDENGNMTSANYSQILGKFSAIPAIDAAETLFNPRPNDTNLEFDRTQNLYKRQRRR